MVIRKPTRSDITQIREILTQWTDQSEVTKYCERIENEIDGKIEFDTYYFVVEDNSGVVGVGGLAAPLPKALPFAKTKNPGEIKILYCNNASRGKGYGSALIKFLEEEAVRSQYTEMLVRSASQYACTAYDFYLHKGYSLVGNLEGETTMAVFSKIL